uniref:Protein-lysine N-methyltransferase SMYD4 n=1 Tax=Periophthalmus magnuspinnatus TaxID=409849 RepID=A0A3B3Z7K7_9GOBI
MDLPCPQWQEHVAVKWAALDSDQRESFASLLDIDDVFQLSLCYANRSAALCHLQLYQVSFSLEKGRHLVAKERIAPGEVVLTDQPYSSVLIPGMNGEENKGELFGTEHRFCHRCLAKTLCLLPCEYCSYSRYCSQTCQKEAWLEHHQWECHLGGDLVLMGVMAQLAVRVTLKAGIKNIQMARHLSESKEPDSDCVGASNYCHANVADRSHGDDSYLSVFHLMHHLSHHSAGLRFLAAVTVATLYLKLSARTGPPPPGSQDLRRPLRETNQSEETSGEKQEEAEDSEWGPEQWLMGSAVLRHLLQLRCNAQAITVLQDTPATSSVQSSHELRIATALFPTLSFLNHSCCPNTSLAFTTGASASPGSDLATDFTGNANREITATIRAAKVIAPGQEILHCYPHSSRMKTQERRRLLFEQYNFQCQCEACSDTHPLQGELEDATARAFATMDWAKAAVHLERSVTAISSQFGEDSIELGRQLFKLTQLHFNGARKAALSVIPKVRQLLRLHCGPECDELQELQAMERCL